MPSTKDSREREKKKKKKKQRFSTATVGHREEGFRGKTMVGGVNPTHPKKRPCEQTPHQHARKDSRETGHEQASPTESVAINEPERIICAHTCQFDFTVDEEGGSAEPARDKNIIGMYRSRGTNPPLLCDPGWVV